MKKRTMIFFFFLLTGCELIVDIDVPFPEAELTLNSFFHADSLWAATLTLNQSILDVEPRRRIEDGQVIIYQDGFPIDTLQHIVSGVYRSDTGKPVPGRAYEIRATAEGYKPVSAHSHVPLPSGITKVELIEGTTTEGYPESTIRITFTDDPLGANFYQIYLDTEVEFPNYENGTISTTYSRLAIYSDDPAVQNQEDFDYDGLFMKDIFFNGAEGTISVKTPGPNIQYFQQAIAVVRTVSEDYYNYKISGKLQQTTSDNPFAQPVNVYDNVEDGFGIFAGYSESTYPIGERPPRPVIHEISPLTGRPGDHVIIRGENFWGADVYQGTVIFSGSNRPIHAAILRASPTELEVIVPDNASTGKIFVGHQSRMAVSDEAFEVLQ